MGQLWPVDLNCCMVMAYRSMQYLARVTGHEADRGPFEAKERALADAVNRRLWDEARGCYADTGRDGTASRVLSPASFMPLFTGIATKPRARSMARIAADPARFFPGMPTVSYDDPKHKSSLRETILGWCARDPEALHEYYDSKTGAALRLRPRCG
jgi:neutral trehalase